MGNEASGTFPGIISYPAAIPGVIAVGATAIDDTRADFSNYKGNHIALCAPGVAIWSTLPTYPGQFGFAAAPGPGGTHVPAAPQRRETQYDAWNGTSMATPHVSAAAALLIAKDSSTDGTTAKTKLQQSADKVAGMNGQQWTRKYGSGRLNLFRLLG
jgi:subtilisin family serine protease